MILGVRFLIMSQEYWHLLGESRLVALTSGMHVSSWSEAGRYGYRLCTQILDAELKPISDIDVILLPRQHFGFDVAALHDGGFAVAWNEKNLIKMQCYDLGGAHQKTIVIGKTDKPGGRVHLATFPTGEIAIGYTDLLTIQAKASLLLCAVSPNAWHFSMACQQNGSLVRVEMIAKNPSYHGGLPSYGLQGSLINQAGIVIGKFYLDVPATIVGNTCSHPDHLAISYLSNGGFVVVWTQLGYTLGNLIQAQIFDEKGVILGKTLVVKAATPSSHVNDPSVAPLNDGSFAVAWSEYEDPILAHRFQLFKNDGSRHGLTVTINDGMSEDRTAIKLERISSGQIVGRWMENGEIRTNLIECHHI